MTEQAAVPSMIILFDAECVLCCGSVRFILRHEGDSSMRFAGTRSIVGRALAQQFGLSPQDLDETFVVLSGARAYVRSDAAILVLQHLRSPWSWLSLMRVVPRPLRDAAYRAIARRRFRLFGRLDRCFAPPPDVRARFIDLA